MGFTVFYFLIIFILCSRKIFKIILNHIDYPITMTSSIVYDINLESHKKNYYDIQPVIIESNKERIIARWK